MTQDEVLELAQKSGFVVANWESKAEQEDRATQTERLNFSRDVSFSCTYENLTIYEGLYLKSLIEAFRKKKIILFETDPEFERRKAKEKEQA